MIAMAHTVETLVAMHRTSWLRDAEALIHVIDWAAFQGRTFHAIDFADLGIASECGMFGFAAGRQLHELANGKLPRRITTTPAAAVAVNCTAIARRLLAPQIGDPDADAAWIGDIVAATVVHEFSHVLAADVADERFDFGTIDTLAAAVNAARVAPVYKPHHHGPTWARAYALLVQRGRALRGHYARRAMFKSDIDDRLPDCAGAVLEALRPELDRDDGDAPLVALLRQPAPEPFIELFNAPTATAV
jgi:hypothetical protein